MTEPAHRITRRRKCRRCNGGGIYGPGYINSGLCLACNGTGEETVIVDTRTKAEKVAARAAFQRRYALLEVLRAELCGNRISVYNHADWGFKLLEQLEPDRAAKALDAIERRDARVVQALADYYEHVMQTRPDLRAADLSVFGGA